MRSKCSAKKKTLVAHLYHKTNACKQKCDRKKRARSIKLISHGELPLRLLCLWRFSLSETIANHDEL